ncbi:DUF2716 domain-containing protein [Streptomyces sp. ISL-11]|uniref:DUF2716 domain-containing protein n=1 Tax=Streptomyces sp. ISL-11 TaxID=2819174 RepID=UPI001BED29C8|nr:DUF2716 domain-containing protein [Streptomyces sp. ISL-11]MBT2382403.1 DUF2716 domain-containing protein [Streptomyces sp. ISL-11]
MTVTAGTLLAAYESQMRGRVPEGLHLPWGAVVERDGPLVRTHYGTHGTVDHSAGLDPDGLDELVRRQQEVFAARGEPVEWKVHSHDAPLLAESLRAAGFTPGAERSLLVADTTDTAGTTDLASAGVPGAGPRTRSWRADGHREKERIRGLAAAAAEQLRPLAELEADGTARVHTSEMEVLVLEGKGPRTQDALWIERVGGTDFAAIGGITGPRPELLAAAVEWASCRSFGFVLPGRRRSRLVAEADAALVPVHTAAGFQEISRVSTYRWAPPGEPARERPAEQLMSQPEHDEIWKRFEKRFEVTYETADGGIAEPPGSVTWHLADIDHRDDPLLAEVEKVIARGLRACGRHGDRLYHLKWYINGSRLDPTRVGGPGQPRWTGYAYLVDERVIQVTGDLRMGTYGDFREASLCVFGAELVARVQDELTDLLGTVLRRDGRPVGNVWSFGP